jgi:FKBP-type peptidyl-prolyl cis-trans isomerase
MKLKQTITASLLALGLTAAVHAEDAKAAPSTPAQPAAPAAASATPATPAAAPAPEFTEAQLLETFGWFIGKRIGLAELGFTNEQAESIVKGLMVAANGKDSPYDLQKIGPEMDKFMQEKQQSYMAKVREQGRAESEKFLKEIKAKAGVVTLPDGLVYEIVKQGNGEFPKATDTVKVHYTGTLVNGTKFDSSLDSGAPAEFALNEVIPGWTEGIQKVSKGGKIRLYIPPELGYGDEAKPGIPPSSTLIFDVELLDVKPAAAPAAPAAASAAPAAGTEKK